jgi:hypothetical protein
MLGKPSFLFHPKIQKCFLIESLVSYQAIFPIDATIPVTQDNDSSSCINLQVDYQLANNQLQVHISKTFHTGVFLTAQGAISLKSRTPATSTLDDIWAFIMIL